MTANIKVKIPLLFTSMMSIMAGAVVSPALPLINDAFQHVANISLLSRFVVTMPALFVALFAPVFGQLIDRFGRVKLLIFCLALYALSGVSGAFITNLFWLLVGRAFLGVAVGGIITISTTLVGDYFEGFERNQFMGVQGAFIGFGGVIMIVSAGILADINWHTPFYLYLIAVPIFLLSIFYLPEPNRSTDGQGVVDRTQHPKVTAPIIFILSTVFGGVVFFYMVPVQVPFLIQSIDGSTSAMVGYAVSICTLASSVVSLFYGLYRRYLNFVTIYAIGFALMGVGYTSISFCTDYWEYLVALGVSGVGLGLFFPTGNLWIMEISAPHLRGRLMGQSGMAFFLGMFVSPIVVSLLASLWSDEMVFRLSGAVLIGIAALFLMLNKRLSFRRITAS